MVTEEVCTNAFNTLRGNLPSLDTEDWGEADTRSKLIDALLFACLGWSDLTDVRRELSEDKLRLDYRLSLSRPVVIIEAKKTGFDFAVRKEHSAPYTIKISTMLRANPSMKEPIDQVVGYCRKWSTPIAVLTNGRTFIFFLGNRVDGTLYEEGNAIIISDVFNQHFDFTHLENYLSKSAVKASNLYSALLGDTDVPIPASIISSYADPDVGIVPNSIGVQIERQLKEVFTDVTKEDSQEVLNNCYVPPSEIVSREVDLDVIVRDMPPAYATVSENIASANAYRKFDEHLDRYLKPQEDQDGDSSRRQWSQTMIVIGGVGVGKTFFLLRHLFAGQNDHKQNNLSFYIDLRRPDVDPEQVPVLIYRKLREQIQVLDGKPVPNEEGTVYDFTSQDGLGQVFRSSMRNFEKLAQDLKQSNPASYDEKKLTAIMEWTKNDRDFVVGVFNVLRIRYHRGVCVVIDNADQCQPPYQHAVYLFARTLEHDLACLIIVALREEWYWQQSQTGGPMSAFHDVIYHIPAAPIRDVLARRLDYAIELLNTRMPVAQFSIKNMVIRAEQIVKYLQIIKRAVLEEEPIAMLFESVANGSIREGLDLFLAFVRSGHTRVEEYMAAIFAKDEYKLRFHQVFKSIAFGPFKYYRSVRSKVPNIVYPLFALSGGWHSYFARPYLLNWLLTRIKLESAAGAGFVPIVDAREFLARLGLTETCRNVLIASAIGTGLIEPDVRLEKLPDAWRYIRIMTKGISLIRRLPARVAYWEAVMLDTPISDPVIRQRITGTWAEGLMPRRISERVLCVREFLKFLSQTEELEQSHIRQSGFENHCPPFMVYVDTVSKPDFDRLDALALTSATGDS
ncbi:MAG: hypothetical protein ABSB74_13540 [Tepidisphaeraceae bacterium]